MLFAWRTPILRPISTLQGIVKRNDFAQTCTTQSCNLLFLWATTALTLLSSRWTTDYYALPFLPSLMDAYPMSPPCTWRLHRTTRHSTRSTASPRCIRGPCLAENAPSLSLHSSIPPGTCQGLQFSHAVGPQQEHFLLRGPDGWSHVPLEISAWCQWRNNREVKLMFAITWGYTLAYGRPNFWSLKKHHHSIQKNIISLCTSTLVPRLLPCRKMGRSLGTRLCTSVCSN